ncbi:hypothetical protein [Actinoallomurus soli]|uniref:hypothetical protein n=1 Tax=Actinoallomurus soli TaxID=2952535 RepID=UPI002093075E|nr:hypothetical protein [Actinoallomurus soli]MCO5973609.1 hypothetical protein [Actinoallomurus soli]
MDAVLVRMLLVSALLPLFSGWNWWMPERAVCLPRLKPDGSGTEHRQERIPLPIGDA